MSSPEQNPDGPLGTGRFVVDEHIVTAQMNDELPKQKIWPYGC
jgi:hypothetical protein